MKVRFSIMSVVVVTFLILINCGGEILVADSDPPQSSSLSVEYTGSKNLGTANGMVEPISLRSTGSSRLISNTTAVDITSTGKGCQVTANWTECSSDDFASYSLYRSKTQFISSDTTSATRLTTVSSITSTIYADNTVANATTYYYALKTTDESGLTSWSNEGDVTTPPDSSGGGGGSALTCYQIQGQAYDSPYEGQDVTVTGIVTVGADEYSAGTGNTQYAVIEDASGGVWSGLVLYGYNGILTSLARGDSVVVSGYVSEFNGLTEVVVNSVDLNAPDRAIPEPEEIFTADVALEKWEGVLVSVSNLTVTEDDLGYGEWYVDDGSGDARIDDMGDYSYSPSIGDTFSEIIGVCFYSLDNRKIEPRNNSDLIQ